jgi:hypothetical protein
VVDRALNGGTPLLVFADDWGRHPSSCQHLVRRLRADTPVLWVNSIGTRQVKADGITLRRKGLQQVDERMWVLDVPMVPGLGTALLRNVNRSLVSFRLRSALASLGMSRPVVLTTLPYIGWLIRDLPRRGLVYYCTDDYSHWPSADREALQQADREMTADADLILAASQALVRPAGRLFRPDLRKARFRAARRGSPPLPAGQPGDDRAEGVLPRVVRVPAQRTPAGGAALRGAAALPRRAGRAADALRR